MKKIFLLLIILVIMIIGKIAVEQIIIKPSNEKIEEVKLSGIKSTLTIKVTDEDNKSLTNCSFEVYDKDGALVNTLFCNENGLATTEFSDPGVYSYQETYTESGYVKDENKYDITIGEEKKAFSKHIINPHEEGALKITVKDANNNPRGNVQVKIYSSIDDSLYKSLTTYGASGTCGIKNMVAGDYYYVIDNRKVEFSITKGNTTNLVDMPIIEDNVEV